MKKTTALLLGLGVCLWAADFWQTKPYTDWSDKDIQKIETSSPWSKQVPVSLEGGGGGGGGSKGGRRGGGGGDVDGSGSGSSMGGGNAHGVQEVPGGGGGSGPALTLTVSWRTALPVRQALAKQKYPDDVATSPDAKKMIEEDQKFYAIMVSGLPGRVLHGGDKMKESLLQNSSLNVKGRDPIPPTDMQVGGNEQRALLLFLFPKTTPLTLDDKEVEFSTKVGPITVKQKFHLKEMVFNGKLDL